MVRFARAVGSLDAEAAFGPGWRLFWLKAVLVCGLVSGFLLSPKLWLAERFYPLTPISALLPNIPPPLDRVWFGTLLVLLVAIALTPRSRWLCLLFVCLAGLLSLWDQSRWQPWFYLYLVTLAAFAVYPYSRPGTDAGQQAILNVGRVAVAATYVWSGLQKCNITFLTEGYKWLLEAFFDEPTLKFAMSGGLIVPLLEIGMGLGLLVPASRRVALVLVLTMHAGLLLCLGPLGQNWNTVVWPWNVAMMAMVVILFWRTQEVSFRAIVWPGTFAYRWLVLLLLGVMPAFNFVGLWDSYLSAALYSSNLIEGDIVISRGVYERSPPAVQRYCEPHGDYYKVDLLTWSMEELNVPPYSEPRIYRRIARSFCLLAQDPGDVVLVIQGRPHWLTGARPQEPPEDCDALSGRADRHTAAPAARFRRTGLISVQIP
jgi:hypothetical protein